jgi:UDP-4-amino-4,6-dideoxy-N-acetyl-beta-L-altrosamine transaminase
MNVPPKPRLGARTQLAINGGNPVRPELLPYGHQVIEDDDIAAITNVLRSEWLTTGPEVAAFEKEFADFVGASHAVAVSSGTAALHGAAFAAGLGPGDEVIVPALTFVATANCARYQGSTVRFADVRPDTLNLDPASVEKLITARTRVIITVDYGGQPSDLSDLIELANHHGLVLIEDASHAVGASYRGSRVGSWADITTFSLHPVKQMTAGEGGVIVTSNPEFSARATLFRNHGITADARQRASAGSWFYEMVELGYNYRLTDLQCALGRSQLKKLPAWLVRRSEIAGRYTQAFSSMPELATPVVLPDRDSAWHLYVIRLNLQRLRVDRAQFFAALRAENIGVNVHYIPVPWQPYYQELGYGRGLWPVTEQVYERLITLPLWAGMTDRDVDDVISAVRRVCDAYSV